MKEQLTSNYWDNRYLQQNTPWNMGQVSPPIARYVDQLDNLDLVILIPGAGHAHEAIYLHQKGFRQVYVCDWAPKAFVWLQQHAPDFPLTHQLVGDFFQLQLKVDLIIEQTFFCAIDPSQRPEYVTKAADLLLPKGKLSGLFWSHQFAGGPPFGGDLKEYKELFSKHFHFLQEDISPYSIPPRAGRELFLELEVK